MARKRIRVKPSKSHSMFSFFVGLVFCGIGIFVVIPSAGLFGVFWTMMAVIITFFNYKNAFTEEGMHTNEIIVDDDSFVRYDDSNNIEERLRKVESLYQQGLITRDEYDQKRKELIDKL